MSKYLGDDDIWEIIRKLLGNLYAKQVHDEHYGEKAEFPFVFTNYSSIPSLPPESFDKTQEMRKIIKIMALFDDIENDGFKIEESKFVKFALESAEAKGLNKSFNRFSAGERLSGIVQKYLGKPKHTKAKRDRKPPELDI